MGARSAHNPPGRVWWPKCAQVSYAHLEGRWRPFFWCKKDNLWKKSCKNFSEIRVTDLREFKKPGRARSGERETEENREGDLISEGLPPLRHNGGHAP